MVKCDYEDSECSKSFFLSYSFVINVQNILYMWWLESLLTFLQIC